MKPRDLADLLTLAAIWGASFLFIRVAAPAFGPVAVAGLRGIGAALVLVPWVAARGELGLLRAKWKPILLVGVTNSALPFLCYGYAALHITAGLSAIFNAATPLFGAVIAWLWLKDSPTPSRTLGLAIGFSGVFWLAWGSAGVKAGADAADAALAVLACLLATTFYGFSASFSKKYLMDVPALVSASGSQIGTTVVLAVPTWLTWPAGTPALPALASMAMLAVLCTGLAYVLYFRLIRNVGPANAITVTFLIPAFAVAWGALFLAESPTPRMLLGCAVILVGTSLATGVLQRLLARPGAG